MSFFEWFLWAATEELFSRSFDDIPPGHVRDAAFRVLGPGYVERRNENLKGLPDLISALNGETPK